MPENYEVYDEASAEEEAEADADDEGLELSGPIILDLGAVRDEPVAEGWHTVKIERAEPGLSRKQRIPKIFVLSRIIDESDPDENRTLIWNAMLKGAGLIFTKRCYAALGFPEVLEYEDVEDLCSDMIDRMVSVQVKHRVYEGKTQANIKDWKEYRAIGY